ncbi:gustatory receptor 8a-like [Anastrepha ludens]|uniref:gustatory receptor 8a-like n=1 Tax=Anastrepha ludens TaxID=28586 RepID=UPI0023B071BA|nr:gustatory receptor 8a-like [Anastrepha ludens]
MCIQVPCVVRFHIRFFQFFGCFDVSLHPQPNQQKRAEHRLSTWTYLLLLVFSLTTVNTFFRPGAFLFIWEGFGYFIDAFKVFMAQITITIIYMETVLCRCALRKFWHRYTMLNQGPNGRGQTTEGDWLTQLCVHRGFLSIFYGITVFDLIIQIAYIIMPPKDDHLLQFWVMFTPFMYLIHVRNMQIIFHIGIIRHELEKLRNDMGLIAEYTSFAQSVAPAVGFEDFVRRKLAEKQLVFQRIYEMFYYFKHAFGISTIAVLLMTYVQLVVDSYFVLHNQNRSWNHKGT